MAKPKDRHSKKSGKKIRLVVTFALLIACIIVTAVFFLWGQNSEEKKQYEAQIKQESQGFTEEIITGLDRIDTSAEALITEGNNTASSTEVPAGVITEAEKQVISDELNKLDDEQKQKVLQTLSVAYSEALNQQKEEAFAMADDLVAQAKADWAALGTGGDRAVKKAEFISEYLAKAKVLEDQMDVSFNSLVTKMENQLEAEGIDPSQIIAQYKSEYETIKDENRSKLMEKAMTAVKN